MAGLRNQIRVLNSALPVQLRGVASTVAGLVPDVQLPAVLPSITRGRSLTLNIPGLAGRTSTRLTIPTPADALKGVESVLPAQVPRLSEALGFGPAAPPANGNGGALVGEAQDRAPTTFRATESASSRVGAGGYRFS
jgi:hypothetical protein